MDQGYYRQPTIAGDRIVFVCEEYLWSVSTAGGAAVRLTVTPGTCSTPRLSPDGEWIAFMADDEGSPELYRMPAAGGKPERLTFLGGTMGAVSGWSGDGQRIVFVSNRHAWYERETRAFAIEPGGQPAELALGHCKAISFGPGGGIVLGRNADDPARWKRYRGGTAGELWIDASANGRFERLISVD